MIDTSVAVVIATHNRLEQLKEAIASVRLQGRAINEIVVVDDASDDGTSRWLSTCDGVRAFRMDGVEDAPSSVRAARARNRGLAEVRSRLVLFLDDDDRLRPRSVERLLAALEHHRRAMFAVGGRIIFSDDGASRRARNYPRFTVKRDILPDLLAGWGAGVGQWLAPTDLVRAIGGWRELPAAEEWEIVVRLSTTGRAVLVPWTVLEERMHPGQWGWEPAERTEVFDLVRRSVPPELGRKQRDAAERAIRGARHQDDAAAAYTQQRYLDALRGYLRAAWTAPTLLLSPLHGPYLARRIARSAVGVVLGRKGAVAAKRAMGSGRRLTKREPQGSTGWR